MSRRFLLCTHCLPVQMLSFMSLAEGEGWVLIKEVEGAYQVPFFLSDSRKYFLTPDFAQSCAFPRRCLPFTTLYSKGRSAVSSILIKLKLFNCSTQEISHCQPLVACDIIFNASIICLYNTVGHWKTITSRTSIKAG